MSNSHGYILEPNLTSVLNNTLIGDYGAKMYIVCFPQKPTWIIFVVRPQARHTSLSQSASSRLRKKPLQSGLDGGFAA